MIMGIHPTVTMVYANISIIFKVPSEQLLAFVAARPGLLMIEMRVEEAMERG